MTKKKSIIIIGLCFALVLMMALSACTWSEFQQKVKDTWDNLVAYDSDGNAMLDGGSYDLPSAMTFKSSAPGTTKTVRVTATIYPLVAANKAVDWSIAWNNASSSWATGKTVTNFVTVTPTADGALTADIAFVANFGEKIIVTCTSRANSSASASCTVDCYQDVTNLSQVLIGGTQNPEGRRDFASGVIAFPDKDVLKNDGQRKTFDSITIPRPSVVVASSSTPYTKPVSVTSSRFYVKLSNEYVTNLVNANFDTASHNYFNGLKQYTEVTASSNDYQDSEYVNSPYVTLWDLYHVLSNGYWTGSALGVEQTYNKFVEAAQNTSGTIFTLKIVVEFEFAGSNTYEIPVVFSSNSLAFVAESVVIDSPSVVF